jgi:hypothetical protein
VRKITYRDGDGNEIGSAALHVNNLPGLTSRLGNWQSFLFLATMVALA